VARELGVEFRKRGRGRGDLAKVSVVVADRAFEAWILAGARGLHAAGRFASRPTFQRFEGAPGLNLKKGLVELGRLLGRDYHKTTDGPRLFSELDFAAARDHRSHGSKSLDKLLRELGL
jgi:hypothetical protein